MPAKDRDPMEHDERTREQARCAIARRATSREDFEQLLAMTGLSETNTSPAGKKIASVACRCKRVTLNASGVCNYCQRYVTNSQVAEVFQAIQRQHRLTPAEIAKRTGMNEATLIMRTRPWRAGDSTPRANLNILVKLKRQLDQELEELLDNEQELGP